MFDRNRGEGDSNFWVSYADLMAGLLFVFILLIGAIISKSTILREALENKEKNLVETKKMLRDNMEKLHEKEIALKTKSQRLERVRKELAQREEALEKGKSKIVVQNEIIVKQRKKIVEVEEKIRLEREEVAKLHNLLSELKERFEKRDLECREGEKRLAKSVSDMRELQKRYDTLYRDITLEKSQLKLKESELEKLNQLLIARNAKIDELNDKIVVLQNLTRDKGATLEEKQKKLQEYIGKVIVLSGKLNRAEEELRLRDRNLTDIVTELDRQKSRYEELISRLRERRAKIRSLTGIKLKVIDALKETLGNRIEVDRETGALRLSSKILFDKGSSTLKKRSEEELRSAFEEYIAALMSNRAVRPYIDRIVIEGHTDSDGGYMYNLALSQQRALAVMNYLLTLPVSKKYGLEKYLTASGRAYLDPIMKDGVEDKEASRRIEIGFRLKNRDAMREIERILDEE